MVFEGIKSLFGFGKKSEEETDEDEDEAMIKIIPPKFSQYLDPILVHKVEKLPAKSGKRLEAMKIIHNTNSLIRMNKELFNGELIEQLAHELTLLVEDGPKEEKIPPATEKNDSHGRSEKQIEKHSTQVNNISFAEEMPTSSSASAPVDLQIAHQQQPHQEMMEMPSAAKLQPLSENTQKELLNTFSSASVDLGPPMAMSNLFSLPDIGLQNANPEMMAFNFDQMNFGSGELDHANMNMVGIENGIEKALAKGYSAYGARACEIVLDIEREQNQTARKNIMEGYGTLRHHSDNVTKQNMHIVDGKKEMELKRIEGIKVTAHKNIDAKFRLANDMIENTFKLQQNQLKIQEKKLDKVHEENMSKIKNFHDENMMRIEAYYNWGKSMIDKQHDLRLATLADSNTINVIQQGALQRMKHEKDLRSWCHKDILENELAKKKVEHQQEMENKREEFRIARDKAHLNLEIQHKQIELMKMQQNLNAPIANVNVNVNTPQQQSSSSTVPIPNQQESATHSAPPMEMTSTSNMNASTDVANAEDTAANEEKNEAENVEEQAQPIITDADEEFDED